MIIKTNFIPQGFAAFSAWPFIFIKPDKYSEALIEHENVHYKSQAFITPFWWLFTG